MLFLADEPRDLWQNSNLDASRSSTDQLIDIVESRFYPRICDPKKLTIWFAFFGDASAREIYRRVMADVDYERLHATVAILAAMSTETGQAALDPVQAALGMEGCTMGCG